MPTPGPASVRSKMSSHKATSFPGLFPLNLGGAGKDPGIGWSRDSKHPKILGVINYDVMNV